MQKLNYCFLPILKIATCALLFLSFFSFLFIYFFASLIILYYFTLIGKRFLDLIGWDLCAKLIGFLITSGNEWYFLLIDANNLQVI